MSPVVSVVAPVYNEAAVLPELARRCLDAVKQIDPAGEVILVDDASTDDTRAVAASLPAGITVLHLTRNRGQLGATQAGLEAARGETLVVLDGDLQDPPEMIPRVVRALRDTPSVDVVFAAKTSREDPAWFKAGRALYGLLARLPGSRVVPAGVGAYCAMRRPWATRAAAVSIDTANLAALLVALGARWTTVPYAKAARYDGVSRIGALGLAREALGSLILTGSAGRGARLGATGFLAIALRLGLRNSVVPGGPLLAAAGLILASHLADRRARHALTARQPAPTLEAREVR